jgi:serine/threonine-protein kinase
MPTRLPTIVEIEAAFSDRYRALSLLNQGGQGVACRATSTDGTVVALKVYETSHVAERSEREVAALRQLKSERLVRLHDAGEVEINGAIYRFIATTFISGTPLADVIAGGPVELAGAVRVLADIIEAIQELWSTQQIVHRDVKPANIIVTSAMRAVLIDLGIARHLTQKTITTAGHTYGTYGYFAPEHFAGRRLSYKADVFAAGIVFQEMLLGSHPTAGRQELLVNGGPRLATLRLKIPGPLEYLVNKMVAKHAFDRPDLESIIGVLKEFLGEKR